MRLCVFCNTLARNSEVASDCPTTSTLQPAEAQLPAAEESAECKGAAVEH